MVLALVPTTLPTPASPKEHSLGHNVYGTGHAGPHCPPLYTKKQQQTLQASCKLAPLSGSPFPDAGKLLGRPDL